MDKRFRKGQLTKEALMIILDDLASIQFNMEGDNKYYYDLVRGNIIDIFGRNTYKRLMDKKGNE